MKIDRACFERGCACYDERIDKDPVEVVKREWVGLTYEEQNFIYQQVKLSGAHEPFWVRFANAIEQALKEKNT